MPEKIEPKFFDVTVGKILDFGNETRHFEFHLGPGKKLRFIPGQFVAVLCPKEGKIIRRAYSIASAPEEEGRFSLVIKRVEGGAVTNWFWGLKAGDSVRVHAPFGKFVLPDPIDFEIVFVATGTGIAPFRSMIHHLLGRGFDRKIGLLFGVRYEENIPYHAEFLELAKQHPNFQYIPTLSKPAPSWKGESGYVQTKVQKFFQEPEGKRVYICGLNDMIQAVQAACLAQGFSKEQVAYEKYD